MVEVVATHDQEQQIKIIKRLLEGWRMALLPLKSIMLWEQQWHPCAIFGSISFIFLIIWLLDLNTIATLAIVGLIFNFVDFIVPVVCNSIYGPSAWTGKEEKMFEEICRNIVISYNKTWHNIRKFYSMRETSPIMYYIISIGILLTLTWVASSINNIFLLYVLSTVMVLWPGIQSRGFLNPLLSMLNLSPKVGFHKSE